MNRLLVALTGVFLLVASATPSFAAQTLEELLEQTKEANAREAVIDQARESEILANRDRQAALLEAAEQRRAAAEKHGQELSTQFDENEKQLGELDTTVKDRLGNLDELFGVVRQTAGDT